MANDPFQLFDEWFAEARASEPNDPEAMALATVDEFGNPAVRMVLLKDRGPNGFVFYTNEESDKGRQLLERPTAGILFHWKSLRRQVRISGPVGRVSEENADAYFATRSRDSQIGAWASDQSRPLKSREVFEAQFDEIKQAYVGEPIPRPAYWGGFKVVPLKFEFWEDRPHRLHERRIFLVQKDGTWFESLLYP